MDPSTKLHTDPIPYSGLTAPHDRMWALPTIPRNIYVAATISEQGVAARFALQLVDAGFCVTSRWLRNDFSKVPNIAELGDKINLHPQLLLNQEKRLWEQWKQYEITWGEQDLEDLERADTLIVLAHEPSRTGGYHVELGYFLGARRDNIVVVGDRRNVFYWTSKVRWTKTTDGLVEWLGSGAHGCQAPIPSVCYDATDKNHSFSDDEVAF